MGASKKEGERERSNERDLLSDDQILLRYNHYRCRWKRGGKWVDDREGMWREMEGQVVKDVCQDREKWSEEEELHTDCLLLRHSSFRNRACVKTRGFVDDGEGGGDTH